MPIEIKISITEDGQFKVDGPLKEEFIMRGMLDKARQTIDQHYLNMSKGKLIQEAITIPPGLRSVN